ncbi:DUF4301 family protein [Pigmentibacter sp. JX0631]|uniref:DUF4301 family protein n=1 Tax=Pigmentibacter sp. JX0631 TaxID=2976982 RepID=UPI0024697C5C|nr:DUF4301 family protein [Pigmentibacter sp. JX0631]WGL59973.1 DUF4301 family protein [Pigmentibacter sp. JX0631]
MQIEGEYNKDKNVDFPNIISPELIKKLQLDLNRINIHHARIKQALNKQIKTTIPIMGACTTSNGGIISWKQITRILSSTYHPSRRKFQKSSLDFWRENHLVTCVPAAGAASRFFSDLQKYIIILNDLIPELKDIFHKFTANKTSFELAFNVRKKIHSTILNIKNIPEISVLFDSLEEHIAEESKKNCYQFYYYLLELLQTGTIESNFNERNTKKTVKKKQTSQQINEQVIRTPWEYNQPLLKTKTEEKNKKIAKYSAQTNHWMDRIVVPNNAINHQKEEFKNEYILFNSHEQNILKSYSICSIFVYLYGTIPKALVPTTIEGDSFLTLKIAEQIKLFPCLGNVLVVPTNLKKDFEQEIIKNSSYLQENINDIFALKDSPFAPTWLKNSTNQKGDWLVLEQGKSLSTIRFNLDGTPYTDEDGNYVPISAGHGELIHLFDSIADSFPNAECLHIRNIDNVIGTSKDRIEELNIPAEAFKIIRDCIEVLRAKIEDHLFHEQINKQAIYKIQDQEVLKVLNYLCSFINQELAQDGLNLCFNSEKHFTGIPFQTIHKIVGNLFHWQPLAEPLNNYSAWEKTLSWLEQPISIFGVVRKEVADIGGGPIFAELSDGTKIKLCIEMPHVDEKETMEYFGPRGKATHFNPVLAFFELRTNKRSFEKEQVLGKKVNYSKLFDDRFWLLTKREYKGVPVCYHETVLHELIGNSATSNLVFIEVPRTLFRPHKSFFDSLGNDRRTYGFDETLVSLETRNF